MEKLTHLNCSIGIVTYLGRFESWFKPLLRKLHFLFPDYDVNVFLNGHHDLGKQVQYLKDATKYLSKYPNVRYVTNINHQAIARGWNWLIFMAACDNILILNDDVTMNIEFRYNLEHLSSVPEIFVINRSWSHFIISKKTIRTIGWFDERFLGMGFEDNDYVFRLAEKGIPIHNLPIHGIFNHVAPQEDASWAKISSVGPFGRHSKINRDFLLKKWFWSEAGPVPEEGSFKVWWHATDMEWTVAPRKDLEEMPEFYPPSILEPLSEIPNVRKYRLSVILVNICSLISSLYWRLRLFLGLGPRLRKLFGRRLPF